MPPKAVNPAMSSIKVPALSAKPAPAIIVDNLERSVLLIVPLSLTIISSVVAKAPAISVRPLYNVII